MFDLGYKQIVLNDLSKISFLEYTGATAGTGQAGELKIAGFATFIMPFTTNASGFVKNWSAGTLGEYSITGLPAGPANYVVTMHITDEDAQDYGINVPFRLQIRSVTSAADFATKLAKGLLAERKEWFKTVDDTTPGTVKLTMAKPSYGFTLTSDAGAAANIAGQSMTIEELAGCNDCQANDALFHDITQDTAQEAAVGSGAWVASQFQNPWEFDAFNFNEAVNLRGKYTSLYIESSADHEMYNDNGTLSSGWEPHEMLGYGDANTTTSYKRRRYVIFINEDALNGEIDHITQDGGALIAPTGNSFFKELTGADFDATKPDAAPLAASWISSVKEPGSVGDAYDSPAGADDPLLNP